MLDFHHLKPGAQLNLPEVVGKLDVQHPEFELLEIHPGGMGMCLQIKSLFNSQSYALKCIRPDLLGDKGSLERFHDELEVWISASVCNAVAEAIAIVRINDIPSVLATWMEGGDLTHARLKLDPARKFESIVRICRALQWAQTKLGIIHRDLKPANILFDSDLLAYLSDWGIARPLRKAFANAGDKADYAGIDRPDRTQLGSFLGTMTYAAPEQIMNTPAVDHRADIYALGCIMFELETGSPPFAGSSIQEIAAKHLSVSPPKLGGLFRNTTLGVERVINRCLAKDPNARYATYEELERDLLTIAKKRNFSLVRCIISERYRRHQLGKGYAAQQQVLANTPVNDKGLGVVEFEDLQPYLEEASNLMALKRYQEAEVLLRPHFIPEIIKSKSSTGWHSGHSFAEVYACCLQQIPGRLDEALAIYAGLSPAQDKPAEFYINYSLALLSDSKWTNAKKVCQRGLTHFPEDIDLLGNYTISLRNCGDIEEAQTVAMRRLEIRRDVHSIEEAVGILTVQRNRLRDSNLPKAISVAETEYNLMKEGLSLNPGFPSLRVTEIQFFRFARAQDKALDACQTIINDEQIPVAYRQLAYLEMVEEIGESKHFKTALELIEKFESENLPAKIQERLSFIKLKICADRYMIGRDDQSGKRIVVQDIVDYFLAKKEGEYPHPVMTARVLEWIGRVNEAETILRGVDTDSENSWNARKELAFLLQRDGRFKEAIAEANSLAEVAPWRAESYDALSFVADKAGNVKLANEAKTKADHVFDEEMQLLEKLQVLIS